MLIDNAVFRAEHFYTVFMYWCKFGNHMRGPNTALFYPISSLTLIYPTFTLKTYMSGWLKGKCGTVLVSWYLLHYDTTLVVM